MIRLADDRLAAVTLATACHGPAMFLGREYLGCWGGGGAEGLVCSLRPGGGGTPWGQEREGEETEGLIYSCKLHICFLIWRRTPQQKTL